MAQLSENISTFPNPNHHNPPHTKVSHHEVLHQTYTILYSMPVDAAFQFLLSEKLILYPHTRPSDVHTPESFAILFTNPSFHRSTSPTCINNTYRHISLFFQQPGKEITYRRKSLHFRSSSDARLQDEYLLSVEKIIRIRNFHISNRGIFISFYLVCIFIHHSINRKFHIRLT